MIAFKAGVRLVRATAALSHIQSCILDTRAELGFPAVCVITSINDSQHSVNSTHYRDGAVDLRTIGRPGGMGTTHRKEQFAGVVRSKLGSRFYVVLEGVGTPNEHIHIQVRKGTDYP